VIKPHVYFVYLGQKQNSRSAILNYRKNKPLQLADYISKTNEITSEMLVVESLEHFQSLIESHESLLSEISSIRACSKTLIP